MTQVAVIGAGPSGLAVAACLTRRGRSVEVLDRADCVGASWRRHYAGLRLHTERKRSGLPHYPMPRTIRKFPTRDEVVRYLEAYAARFALPVTFGAAVQAVCPAGAGWPVRHAKGQVSAQAVVFATGLNGVPHRGHVPGIETFRGPVHHSSEYTEAAAYRGRTVLVVGFGNSGGDIALELAEAGAKPVLSVRSPVNILPFSLFGVPITSMGGLRKVLPYRAVDALTAPLLRAKIGRPEEYGLIPAGKGPAAQVIEDGRVPLIDHGTLAAIKAGRIAVRRGIAEVTSADVRFVDGPPIAPDAIILATGYRVDLRALLPDTPDALDPDGRPYISGAPGTVPGLYFCSYRASADGQLRQSGIEAEAIARHIAERISV